MKELLAITLLSILLVVTSRMAYAMKKIYQQITKKEDKFMKKIVISLMVLCLSIFYLNNSGFAEIRMGVNAERGELKAIEKWGELAKYLSSETGQTVKLVPLLVSNILDAAKNGEADILLANPLFTVIIKEKHNFNPIATLNETTGSQFAGVIIASRGSGITKGTDLKGKKVMSLKFKVAAGAYLFQAYHLYQQGIDVHKDFASFTEAKKQDDIVLAVKAGLIDAGFIRSGQLESMEKEGKIKIDEFVIVDQRTDPRFPFVHSTVLYPEWFFSTTAKMDQNLVARIKGALLKLKPENKAAKTADINGFIEPLSLDGLKKAMKTLKVAPYDK